MVLFFLSFLLTLGRHLPTVKFIGIVCYVFEIFIGKVSYIYHLHRTKISMVQQAMMRLYID